jgi:hypothetical protein|eukprot:COSAG01_NODE_709_length_14119_cov_107.401213_3_plen_99_part_00
MNISLGSRLCAGHRAPKAGAVRGALQPSRTKKQHAAPGGSGGGGGGGGESFLRVHWVAVPQASCARRVNRRRPERARSAAAGGGAPEEGSAGPAPRQH